MSNDEMTVLERNVRLRNGRRELPRERPRPFRDDALETLGHITIYTVIAATIFVSLYVAFSIADSQMAIEDKINQENVNVQRP